MTSNGVRTVVLASTSPRRRELIGGLDLEVVFAATDGVEGPPANEESPESYVLRLSAEKALGAAGPNPSAIIIGADTIVVLEDRVLGKPEGHREAREMLRRLRGRTHSVLTGVTVLDTATGRRHGAVQVSEVTMRSYDDKEISEYVASGEPMDKAGAYAVQDPHFRPAETVIGCYPNVVGLPMCDVVDLLARVGVEVGPYADSDTKAKCTACPLTTAEEVSGS